MLVKVSTVESLSFARIERQNAPRVGYQPGRGFSVLGVHADEVYAAIDWLLARQDTIENKSPKSPSSLTVMSSGANSPASREELFE